MTQYWNLPQLYEDQILKRDSVSIKRITCIALSPYGKLASVNRDGTIDIWRSDRDGLFQVAQTLENPEQLPRAHFIAFSPDDTLISTSSNGRIKIWKPDAAGLYKMAQILEEGQRNAIHSLAFSPDDALASGISLRGTIKTWKPDTNGLYKPDQASENPHFRLRTVALSSRSTLASGSSDGIIKSGRLTLFK